MKRTIFATIFLILTLATTSFAGSLLQNPKFQAWDSNGDPLTGGLLYTYVAGTTTNKATYSDRALSTPNANPIVLDSNGQATIWGSGQYKFVLKDSDGVTQWTVDNIEGIGGSTFSMIGDYGGDLDAAIDSIGATETTLYIDETATLSESKTAPATLKIEVLEGGAIAMSTYNLTINGPFECGTHSCFTGSGNLTLGMATTIYADWFGASKNKACIAAMCSRLGSTNAYDVTFSQSTWTIDDDLTITKNFALQVPRGCTFSITAAKTLTINGPITAGLYTLFSTSGTVVFGLCSTREVYPQWWGATGDQNNQTNAYTELNAMLTSAKATVDAMADPSTAPLVIYFPPGIYKTSSKLTYSTTDTDGYTIFKGDYVKSQIRGGTTATTVFEVNNSGGDVVYGIRLEGLFFRSYDQTNGSTVPNVILKQCELSSVRHCYFDGGSSGLELDGCRRMYVENSRAEVVGGALATDGGLNIIGDLRASQRVSVTNWRSTGCWANAIRVADSYDCKIVDSHLDTCQNGIYLDNADKIIISHNYIKDIGKKKTTDLGRFIESIDDSDFNMVTNNYMGAATDYVDYGIYVDSDGDGGSYWTITGNIISEAQTGILFGAAASKAIVTANVINHGSGTAFSYTNTSHACVNNWVTGGYSSGQIGQFTNADATPSVIDCFPVYKTANTGATTITMLDNGFVGQNVKVWIADANTTVDFTGTNLYGNSGADWSATQNDYMDCFFSGSQWHCSVHSCP